MSDSKHTPGPWEYVPGTQHHGPYITSAFGSTIADCYTMSMPFERSTANGGPSKPLPFLHEMAEPNARLIAAAPELMEALEAHDEYMSAHYPEGPACDALHPTASANWVRIRAAIAKARGQ